MEDHQHRLLEPIRDQAGFLRFIADFTSYERLANYRYDPETLKLERMLSFAAALGHPQRDFLSIHVAGTKGKGTTCLILEALLARGQRRIGCYLSPHIEDIRERIRVDGKPISELDLCATLNAMLPELERRRALGPEQFPTFFELMTAIAMARFSESRVEYGIFEVGLGGRLDATNILPASWTAITSIGLEHTDKLGNTLASIAREKGGILKAGVPLVLGPMEDEARLAILEIARRLSCPVQEVAAEMVAALPGGGLRIDGFPGTFPCGPIRGPGLRTDLAVAVTLWKQIVDVSDAHDARRAIEPAIAGLELPARIEVLDSDPPLVVDGAHTPESVAALRAALEEIGWPRPRSVVLSVCSDKRIDAILAEIIRLADEVFFTRCDPVRSLPPQELASRFEAASGIAVPAERVIVDPREAFERALALGLPVVITGSLYLAGALRRRAHEHRALVRPAS